MRRLDQHATRLPPINLMFGQTFLRLPSRCPTWIRGDTSRQFITDDAIVTYLPYMRTLEFRGPGGPRLREKFVVELLKVPPMESPLLAPALDGSGEKDRG